LELPSADGIVTSISARTKNEVARSDGGPKGATGLAPAEPALVADHDLVRRRVAAALARGGVSRIRRYASPDDLFEAAAHPAPEIAIICWERVGPEQVATLGRLREAFPETHVVLVAASFARSSLAAALDNGLAGFVQESEIDDCLLLAVEAARRGQVLLPRAFGKVAAQPGLSVREKQILALVVMGLSNAEIAQTLFVTESTVKSHLSSAFTRLGVRSRNQATALILDPERGFGPGILAISSDEQRRSPS
jgi:DNA-binding NarL/FixJ family response regulator